MSTLDLFLRFFVGLQVGLVFLIVCVGLFLEFWDEVVRRPRRERKQCKRLEEEPLYVPRAWSYSREPRIDMLDEPAQDWFFEEMEW
jgi:hypothetical protein